MRGQTRELLPRTAPSASREATLALLLDSGAPLYAARGGHDPAVLLKSYAKRTKKADQSAPKEVSALSKGVPGK
jgi:hypothetical protein